MESEGGNEMIFKSGESACPNGFRNETGIGIRIKWGMELKDGNEHGNESWIEMEMKIKLYTLSAKSCLNRETNTGQKMKIVNSRQKDIFCQWRHDLLLLDI